MITLYHGSNRFFNQFEIHEKWVQRPIETLAEGMGIYLTEDKAFAASYGEHLYEVTIKENQLTDFTDEATIRQLLATLSEKLAIPFMTWLNVPRFIESVQSGNISVTTLYEEINLLVDNNEAFYAQYGHLVTDEEDCLLEQIKLHFLASIQDVIKYYDKGFKQVVYICIRNPENLHIKNR